MEIKKILKENYSYFQSELPKLLKDKNKLGKFAIIKNKMIVGIYDSFDKALSIAIEEKKFKSETFLVQKIEKQETEYISRIA